MRTEFEFIQHIKKTFSLDRIGDDCAVLPKDARTDMVVTSDLLVEDIDFRLDWSTPEQLGWKALAVSVSDVAAMGAEARWSMISVAVPKPIWASDFLDKFYHGWSLLAESLAVELVGGDISETSDKIVIDSTVGGDLPKARAILRSTAKPGDSIFVSGRLGGAAAGLKLLKDGLRHSDRLSPWQRKLIHCQLQPTPRAEIAVRLSSSSLATSMIDLSDGLSSDLRHICEQSGVGATIFADSIPLAAGLSEMGVTFGEALDFALNGGEDFELLFTGSRERLLDSEIPDIHLVGEITANEGVIELDRDGKLEILHPAGYRHF